MTRIIQYPFAFLLACQILTVAVLARPVATLGLAETGLKSCQTDSEQPRLIDEAEKNKYAVRRIEFVGNATTGHMVLARRVVFTEGDLFTRKLLEQSLKNLSELKIIKPVRVEDVDVYLDREEKLIDLVIHVTEKRRS